MRFFWFLQVFEELLLDADWSLNAGNWMWLSASAFFHQYFRVYSPVAFGKKTDKNGDYIKYVEEIAQFFCNAIFLPLGILSELWEMVCNSDLSLENVMHCNIPSVYCNCRCPQSVFRLSNHPMLCKVWAMGFCEVENLTWICLKKKKIFIFFRVLPGHECSQLEAMSHSSLTVIQPSICKAMTV